MVSNFFHTTGSGNILGGFYRKLPMGRKDTNFGQVTREKTLGRWQVKYTEIFVVRQIY